MYTDYLSLSLVLGAFEQLLHSTPSSPLKPDAKFLPTFHRRYYAYNTQTSLDRSIKIYRFITNHNRTQTAMNNDHNKKTDTHDGTIKKNRTAQLGLTQHK